MGKKGKIQAAHFRAVDQETARVVAVLGKRGIIVGSGGLINGLRVLTCYHVIEAALGGFKPKLNARLQIKLIGFDPQIVVWASVVKLGDFEPHRNPINDLCLLQLDVEQVIPPAEFATPLRHAGKKFTTLGFPDGDDQGANASGLLQATNAKGLVQMDGDSSLFVKGGFSGGLVWSPDVGGYVGMVVTELYDNRVAWCIPSRQLCRFYNDLLVRLHIPPADRPKIHDYWTDDPNVQLFGQISDNGQRKLTAKISKQYDEAGELYYCVKATYKLKQNSPKARGGYVTFIMYPDFERDGFDSYELFSILKGNKAEVEFYPSESFTIAAIGDAGDTALTLDLAKVKRKPKSFS